MTVWGDKVDDVLDDGRWHTQAEVVASAVGLVPPGVAWREGNRRRLHTGKPIPADRTWGGDEQSVASGARSKVQQAIDHRIRGGHIERRGPVGALEYRKAIRSTSVAS